MKKSILLSVLAIGFLSFASCEKDDTTLPTGGQRETNGSIILNNNSTNPYKVTGIGSPKTIGGNRSNSYSVKPGTYYLTATQESGYLVYPTIVEKTIYVTQGSVTSFNFP